MSRCHAFEPDPCTACRPRVPITPLPVNVRPGQSWVETRAGTFSTFRQAMLDRLQLDPVRSVAPDDSTAGQVLTTREPDDFAVAILDLWAYVCDIQAFYNQADLNEGFLRTAVLRESVEMMARLIGYRASPGVAASVFLAFEADAGISATLPAGFQTQSVPEPGHDAATFETDGPLTIRDSANGPTLLGDPAGARFERSGLLVSDSNGPKVAVGSRLIFFKTGGAATVQRVVTSVVPHPLGRNVGWAAPMGGLAVLDWHVSRLGRTLKAFGVHAPASYLTPAGSGVTTLAKFESTSAISKIAEVAADTSTGDPKFVVTQTSFAGGGGKTLALDGNFEGLTQGTRLLLQYGGPSPWVLETVVVDSGSAGQSRGPISGTSTVLTLQDSIPSMPDVRFLSAFELLGDPLDFSPLAFSGQILRGGAGGGTSLYVADASGLKRGSRMVITSGGLGHVATVSADPDRPASVAPAWRVRITPGLPWDLDVVGARLYGNVIGATHGETQREAVLGDGDASQSSQQFEVPASPVTYVPDSGSDSAASSTLRLFVDGAEWTEVPSLFGRGPDEAVFVTNQLGPQVTWVRGGDGKTGRRFPTGLGNLRVRTRKGLGLSGNTEADSISVLLQTWPGVKAVTNPMASAGGAEPEPPDEIRRNAPAGVTTLGRAVSVLDYERLALTYLRGGKARASWGEFHSRRGVVLTCMPASGQPLSAVLPGLKEYLDHRRDRSVPLAIREAKRIPFSFRITLHVIAGLKQSVARGAALGIIQVSLNLDAMPLGETLHQSRLLASFQAVPGVEWVRLDAFDSELADHAFLDESGRLEAVYVGPDEVASLSSFVLTLAGGLNDLEAT
ncbi:hypothetical protein P12x_000803 [Tundrisphaera lichenicola]|uniref:hypothetical protein n=1 Tax=Tundrisphaera lichenicola TaxID=2029860 RepID=UPI003EBE97D7